MTKFKKADKAILHPPDDLEWYRLEMSGGVMTRAPAEWLKKKTE